MSEDPPQEPSPRKGGSAFPPGSPIPRPVPDETPPAARRRVLLAAVLVISVIALFLLLRTGSCRAHHAAPDPDAVVLLAAPVGEVSSPPRTFTWTPVPGAAAYRVTIGDADAIWPLYVRSTSQPKLSLAPGEETAIAPGRVHAWSVEALDEAGVPRARGEARFLLAPAPAEAGAGATAGPAATSPRAPVPASAPAPGAGAPD